MEHVFTNRASHVRGGTSSVTVRLPDEIVAYIDAHLDKDIANRSEFLQHWAQVGIRVSMSEELTEALDWALDQTVQEPEPELQIPLAEIMAVEKAAGPSWLPEPKGWEQSTPSLDEIAAIRDAQLEALRSRVK